MGECGENNHAIRHLGHWNHTCWAQAPDHADGDHAKDDLQESFIPHQGTPMKLSFMTGNLKPPHLFSAPLLFTPFACTS